MNSSLDALIKNLTDDHFRDLLETVKQKEFIHMNT